MAVVKRSGKQSVFTILAKNLDELDGLEARVGWLSSAHYENGMPLAKIAAVQELGATINHPGGTPYKIGTDGLAVFVPKSSPEAAGLPLTKPHTITIPPRPFMRPTASEQGKAWVSMLGQGAKAVLNGKIAAKDVLAVVAQRAAKDVSAKIASIIAPPLARSTVRKRLARLSDKAVTKTLEKPLVDSGLLMTSVTSVVEKTS